MMRRPLLPLLLLLALVAGGLLASPAHAQEEGIRCTTTTAQSLIPTGQDVFFSAEPRSTESGNVLFFWSTGDLEGNSGNSDGNIELFRSQLVFNADGTVSRTFRQITRSTGSILGGFNLAPDVSADGRYLAFFSDRHYPASGFDNTDGNFEIFVADLADLNNIQIRQITNTSQGSNLYPSISDDGMRIAFISDNGLDPATAGTVADEDRNLDIYLADLSGATPVFRQITQTALGILNEAPSLSGDGSTLVFASSQVALANPEGNQEIFRFVLASGAMQAVTSTAGGTHEMPVISGNGARIAFVSDQRLDPSVNIVGQRQVFLHPNPATGSGFLQISDTVGADNFNPNISADGNRVIYQRQDGSGQQVVLYDSISQSRQVFRSRPNPTTGEVGQPILSGNGTVLFYEDEGGISTVECSISDLGLTAAVTPTTAIAGESQTQVWTVSNLDQAVASDVQIRATLPAGFRIMQIEPGGICSQNGQQIACAYSRLGIGASEVMTVTTAIDPDVTGAPVTNVAVSSASSADRNPDNNTLALATSVLAQADLQIGKSADPDTALRTEPITYTLVVRNNGPSVARQVQMIDSLPSALDFLSSDLCSAGGGALLCALGDMAPGARITATVRTRVNTAVFAEQEIVNSAFVLSSQTSDPLPLNNTVAITNSINTKFDLSVTKTVAPTPLLAGGPITYTILVRNSGPSIADGVRLSDTLPAEIFNITTPTTTLGLCTDRLSFTCDFGALNREQVVTVTVSGMLSPTLSGVITNTATVFSLVEANADRQPSNDVSVLATLVEQQADLLAEKFATPAGSVAAGDTLTYTLGVTNRGPSVADNVTISDTLPAGVTITGLATSLGQCTGSTLRQAQDTALVSCQIGSLAPGERAAVTVTVRVNSTTLGVLTNTVSAQSTTQDPNALNNDASVATTVTDAANLVLSKTASVAAATAGQSSFFYTLVVGNSGPSLARSVLLTDTLPSGVTYVESTPPAGATCSHAAGIVTCDLGSIAAGISQTVRLDVEVAAEAIGVLTNTAAVSTSAVDPTGDNTATATVISSQSADLQVMKRAVIDNLNVGGTVTYTVNVDNFGPSNA
ncbi:MAG: DUF11 domain-containing protein, partial [Chloroflexi bacterium]|nr:DUF11 domain-containing protein [Chloroflexota bacterium]